MLVFHCNILLLKWKDTWAFSVSVLSNISLCWNIMFNTYYRWMLSCVLSINSVSTCCCLSFRLKFQLILHPYQWHTHWTKRQKFCIEKGVQHEDQDEHKQPCCHCHRWQVHQLFKRQHLESDVFHLSTALTSHFHKKPLRPQALSMMMKSAITVSQQPSK